MRDAYSGEYFDADRSVWKGAVAGVVGGLVASWVMNKFQSGIAGVAGANGNQERSESGEDATQKAATAISEVVLDRPLDRREKQAAAPVVHYAFGSIVGALYGALAEWKPATATALGLPFGTAVWLGADEIGVPLFGLSKAPTEFPASTHASACASHLVYGLTADVVRRSVRAVI